MTLISCNHLGRSSKSSNTTFTIINKGLPSINQLEENNRIISNTDYSKKGDEFYNDGKKDFKSANATVDGKTLKLNSSSNKPEFALYQFGSYQSPEKLLSAVLSISSKTEKCFIAIADYDLGFWDWIEYSTTNPISFDLAKYKNIVSPKGYCYFAVVAWNADIVVNNISVSTDGLPTTEAPNSLVASDGYYLDKIELYWEAPKNDVPDGYKIYRSTSKTGPFTLIDQVGKVTTFIDSKLTDTNVYYYKLNSLALSGHRESLDSNIDAGNYADNQQGEWYQEGSDQSIDRFTQLKTPTTNTIKWTYKPGTTGAITNTAVVQAKDGTYYYVSNDGALISLDIKGVKKWTVKSAQPFNKTPAIGFDGCIYVVGDETCSAYNPDGTIRWIVKADSFFSSPVTYGQDGNIYIADDSSLHAITPWGKMLWTFKTSGSITSAPSIASNGTVYVCSRDKNLYALYPDGTKKWSYSTTSENNFSPVIDGDCVIYVVNNINELHAVTPEGSKKWIYKASTQVLSEPSVNHLGYVIIRTDNNLIIVKAIDGKSTINMIYMGITCSPILDYSDYHYIGINQNKIYATNNNDGIAKWVLINDAPSTALSIGNDGSILARLSDGSVVCIGPGDNSTPALNPPSQVVASDAEYNDKIRLNWLHSSGTKPDGYSIYRSDSLANPFVKIADVGYTNHYDDTTIPDINKYYYYLKAYSKSLPDSTSSNTDVGNKLKLATWIKHEITTDKIDFPTQVLVQDKPAIAYYDTTKMTLKCAQSKVPEPSQSSDWDIMTVDNLGNVGKYCSLACTDSGRLAVSYTNHISDISSDLKFAYTLNVPSKSTDWKFYKILNGDIRSTSIQFMSDIPIICYQTQKSAKLYYIKALTSFPVSNTDWDTPVLLDTSPLDLPGYCSMTITQGDRPVISYSHSDVTGKFDINFASSIHSDPIDASQWNISKIEQGESTFFYNSCASEFNSMPVICFGQKFARATALLPNSAYVWLSMEFTPGADTSTYGSIAIMKDGKPVISFCDVNTTTLKFAKASTNTPSSISDWSIEDVDKTNPSGQGSSTIILSGGQPGICYKINDTLHYAWWDQ